MAPTLQDFMQRYSEGIGPVEGFATRQHVCVLFWLLRSATAAGRSILLRRNFQVSCLRKQIKNIKNAHLLPEMAQGTNEVSVLHY